MNITKFVIIPSFIIVLCLIFFFTSQKNNRRPFHCDAQSIIHIIKDGENETYINSYIDIIFSSEDQGVMMFSGTAKSKDKDYIISRKIFFTITKTELERVNKTVYTHEKIDAKDNTPAELWYDRVLPEIPGIELYSEVKKLHKNAILIKAFSVPLIVCVRQ